MYTTYFTPANRCFRWPDSGYVDLDARTEVLHCSMQRSYVIPTSTQMVSILKVLHASAQTQLGMNHPLLPKSHDWNIN